MAQVAEFRRVTPGGNAFALPKGTKITFKDGSVISADDPGRLWLSQDIALMERVEAPDGTVQVFAQEPEQIPTPDPTVQTPTTVRTGKTKQGLDVPQPSRTTDTNGRQEEVLGPNERFQSDGTILNTATGAVRGSSGASGTAQGGEVDMSSLRNSAEYQALSADEQQALEAVFSAIAANDAEAASRLEGAFRAATQIADPFFAQQIRLAADAVQRGFVSIDSEEAFKEQQLQNALTDLRTDIANKQEFLSLDESNVLRGIERSFGVQLKNTRQNLAATGFTQSSRRAEAEQLLEAERTDLIESTTRKFAFEQDAAQNQLSRGERDLQLESERLAELAQEGKLDLLRSGEEQLGTANLPSIAGAPSPLGGIAGDIPQRRQSDIIAGAQNLIF